MGKVVLALRVLLLTLLVATLTFNVAATPATGSPGDAKVRVFVVFDRTPGPNERTLVENAGGKVHYVYHLVPAISTTIPEAARDRLRANPRVVAIEPVRTVRLSSHPSVTDPEYPWGVAHIGTRSVHDGGNKGLGISIAILDSGVDYTHPDLAARFVGGPWGDVKGYDFFNNDEDPMDDHGHGTHVAGSAAASIDGAYVAGVAPEARLYALKVFDAAGEGSWDSVVAALEWSVDHGVQVTNNSYLETFDPGVTVRAAFDNSYARGVLHFAAAGNNGFCLFICPDNTAGWPARYESAIAVGATDSNDKRAYFSSYGPELELAAPGVSILSDKWGGGTTTMDGTSMASPHAAGVGALVLACGCLTDENGDGVVDQVDARLRLQKTASDLGTAGRDVYYGYGLVDAAAAVGIVAIKGVSVSPSPFSPNADGVKDTTTIGFSVSEAATWSVSVGDRTFEGTASGPGQVSVAWDGKNAAGAVVSDGAYPVVIRATESAGVATASTSVSVDTTPPAIANVAPGTVTSSWAEVTWTTNEATDSLVEYGTVSGTYTRTASSALLVTQHKVALFGLQPSTTYYYRVTSVDTAGNRAISPERSFKTLLAITGVSVAPSAFSPNGDGVKDTTTISFKVSEAAAWSVSVSDRAFTGSTSGAGQASAIWDGKNGAGAVVADGSYAVAIKATGSTGTATASTTAKVDTTPPTVSSILAANVTDRSADITWDTNEWSDSRVDYGTIAGTYTRTVSITALLTKHKIILSSLQPSTTYYYRVASSDAAGNKTVGSEGSFKTLVAITGVTVAPNPFSPNGDGLKDTTTISFSVSEAAAWSVSVSDRAFTGSTTGAGQASAVWDGKNSAGSVVADGSYTVAISATGSAGSTDTTTASTSVKVDTTPPILSNVLAGNITNRSADITWDTNEPSDSVVEYGTIAGTYTRTVSSTLLYTKHKVFLSSLQASTTYYYRARSTDGVGNRAVSPEQSFTTLATPKMGVNDLAWNSTVTALSWTVNVRRDNASPSGTLTIDDSPVQGASLKVVLTLDANGDGVFECGAGKRDKCWTYFSTTDASGNRTLTLSKPSAGRYKAEVTSLTSSTAVWDKTLDRGNPSYFTR